MHVRGFCLCQPCIAQISVEDEIAAERQRQGRAWFEASKARKSDSESVANGVVRRCKS
jgi:hypothetical protein